MEQSTREQILETIQNETISKKKVECEYKGKKIVCWVYEPSIEDRITLIEKKAISDLLKFGLWCAILLTKDEQGKRIFQDEDYDLIVKQKESKFFMLLMQESANMIDLSTKKLKG